MAPDGVADAAGLPVAVPRYLEGRPSSGQRSPRSGLTRPQFYGEISAGLEEHGEPSKGFDHVFTRLVPTTPFDVTDVVLPPKLGQWICEKTGRGPRQSHRGPGTRRLISSQSPHFIAAESQCGSATIGSRCVLNVPVNPDPVFRRYHAKGESICETWHSHRSSEWLLFAYYAHMWPPRRARNEAKRDSKSQASSTRPDVRPQL